MTHDTELFELCKEVYKRTGWDEFFLAKNETEAARNGLIDDFRLVLPRRIGDGVWESPLYTSDYLLGKLPHNTYLLKDIWLTKPMPSYGYTAKCSNNFREDISKRFAEVAFDKSPLKALLKLTIALDDAGVKL